MDKRKKMKIIFLIIAIMLGLVLIEVGIRATVDFVDEFVENKKEEKAQEEFYNSKPEQNKRNVTEFVESICEAIKIDDYNYIYENLDEIYAEYMFNNNIENLHQYLKQFSLGNKHTVTKVSKTANVYHVLVGIESGEEYTSRYFSVKETVTSGENEYEFMFDEYTSIKKTKHTVSGNDAIYSLNYLLESPYYLIYVFDIENSSNKSDNRNVTLNNISLTTTNGQKINGNLLENVGIETDDGKHRVHMVFPKKSSSVSFIQFDSVVNENEKNIKIFLQNGIV